MRKYRDNIVAGLIPLFALGFVSHMAPYIYMPSLPDIADCIGLDRSETTSLMSAYSLALSLSLLLAGTVGDRCDKKKLLAGASAIIFTGAMMASLASYAAMLAGWALQGIGAAMVTVVSQTWIAQRSGKDNITSLFSCMAIILSLAPLVAPVIGGVITETGFWKYNFVIVALLSLLCCVFISRTMPPAPIRHPEASVRQVLSGYTRIMFRSVFLPVTGTSLACFMFQGSLMAYSSFLFIDRMGVSPSLYGCISVPVIAGGIAGQLAVVYLEKKRSLVDAYLFNSITAAAALLGSLLFYMATGTHTVTELACVIFVFSIGAGGQSLLAIRNVMALFPSESSRSSALLNFLNQFAGYMAVASVQFIFALVESPFTIHNMMCGITVILIAFTTFGYRIYRKIPAMAS